MPAFTDDRSHSIQRSRVGVSSDTGVMGKSIKKVLLLWSGVLVLDGENDTIVPIGSLTFKPCTCSPIRLRSWGNPHREIDLLSECEYDKVGDSSGFRAIAAIARMSARTQSLSCMGNCDLLFLHSRMVGIAHR